MVGTDRQPKQRLGEASNPAHLVCPLSTGGVIPRALSSLSTVFGIARHEHEAAWARCHSIRDSSEGFFGIACF
jgi:hypothetical protein